MSQRRSVSATPAAGAPGFGVWVSGVVPSIDAFGYIISAVRTRLFLVAGTFFPVGSLPDWARTLAQGNPIYHCVELVRHAVFGLRPGPDLAYVGALVLFALLMWRLAIYQLERRLID